MRFIEVGKIISTFGIKGELKVISDSDFIEDRFKVGNILYLKNHKQMEKVKISQVRFHQEYLLITVNDLNDINLVLEYVGCTLFVDQDSLNPLPEGEYYVHQLIGCKVYNTLGDILGIVKDIIEIPSSSILEVYDEKNKKILIPFTSAFVKEVNQDKIIIDEIEGLR